MSLSVAPKSDARPLGSACVLIVAEILILGYPGGASSAEFGSSPYPKGFRDIFAGIIPPVPGLYVLNDVYHYEGSVGATVFNGAVQVSVDAKYTADFLPLTYVTKWKILGGTYAFGVDRQLRQTVTQRRAS